MTDKDFDYQEWLDMYISGLHHSFDYQKQHMGGETYVQVVVTEHNLAMARESVRNAGLKIVGMHPYRSPGMTVLRIAREKS